MESKSSRKLTRLLRGRKNLAAAALALFFLVWLIPGFNLHVRNFLDLRYDARVAEVRELLSEEQAHLARQAAEMVESRILTPDILQENPLLLLDLLNAEKRRRDAGMILVVNREGATITRTDAVGKIGDYVLQTTDWGRALVRDGEVASIGYGSVNPLVMIAGRRIMAGDHPAGAVFAGHRLDDAYSLRLKERLSGYAPELVLYSREHGVTGDSFRDPEISEHLRAYFNTGSSWVQEGYGDERVEIGGRTYLVRNIAFQGKEEWVGGMLVFFPYDESLQSFVFAGLVALMFVLISALLLAHWHGWRDLLIPRFPSWPVFSAVSVMAMAFFLLAFSVNRIFLEQGVVEIGPTPHLIYNSTLEFYPETDVLQVGAAHQVSIRILSGGEAVNAAQTIVEYDPEAVRVEEILTANSFCNRDLFLAREIDHEAGRVTIACGLPSPGFHDRVGTVADLILRPIRPGSFDLTFGEDTQVLANDGLGTDVLRLAKDSTFQAIRSSSKDPAETEIIIFSSSHPNSNQWYNRRKAVFSWLPGEGYEYRYALTSAPDAVPDLASRTADNLVAIDLERSGEYWFHLLPVKDGVPGSPGRYKIRADLDPPPPPSIRASQTDLRTGEIIRFEFAGTEDLSGLQSGFYVRLNGSVFLPVGPQLYTTFLEPGTHEVTLRVFDKAGNWSDSSLTVRVSGRSFVSRLFGLGPR